MCVVSHHFNMHFSDGIGCWVSFHMLICHLYIFHDEVSAKVFGPFQNWVVFSWVLKVPCIFWIMALYHRNLLWLFSLKLWTIFSFSWYYLSQNISFYFSEADLLNYFFFGPYPKHHQYHQGNLSFLLCYLLEILCSFNIYIFYYLLEEYMLKLSITCMCREISTWREIYLFLHAHNCKK